MAGASDLIRIDYDDAAVKQSLKKLLDKLGDLTPVFQDIGESLLISHRERFDRWEISSDSPMS